MICILSFLGYKTEGQCLGANKGQERYVWAVPYDAADVKQKQCLVALEKPECYEAPWSRYSNIFLLINSGIMKQHYNDMSNSLPLYIHDLRYSSHAYSSGSFEFGKFRFY